MISAYRIGDHIYLVGTDEVADPNPPALLPIGSTQLTLEQALLLAAQITSASAWPAKTAVK
jgi:hypothetical protein